MYSINHFVVKYKLLNKSKMEGLLSQDVGLYEWHFPKKQKKQKQTLIGLIYADFPTLVF